MRPGDRISQRYEIGDLAGRGGMGVVYRAVDLVSRDVVSIKVLLDQDAGLLERFRRETEIVGKLDHPHIARSLGCGQLADGRAFLALEWIEGSSLADRLRDGPLAVVDALQLAVAVASALGAVHADGVVHRDLKPSNVLLRGGATSAPVIIDFGVAHRMDAAITRTGVVVGTPTYMAPEQATGDKGIDARADVFALGCLLYECLVGRPAFAGAHPLAALSKVLLEAPPRIREERPDLPEAVDAFVMRLLDKQRDGRPRDGATAAALLSRLIDDVRASAAAEEPLVATLPRSVLTAAEQRVVSVLVVRAPASPSEVRMDRVREAVSAFDGRAHGLVGGVLLVTITPSAVATDHAVRAARCALALRAFMPDEPMALAVGRALVQEGKVGGSVIDAAASLLESAPPTPTTAVRLDDVAAGLLDAAFDVRGDATSLLLLGERDTTAPARPRPVLGVSVPFVGRRREIAFIQGLIEECREERRAQAVLVTAPPGLGKSRLAAEVLGRLSSEALSVWWSAAEPSALALPFAIVGQLVAHAAQLRLDETRDVRTKKLRARFGRELAAEARDRVVSSLEELVPSREDVEDAAFGRTLGASTSLADRARVAWLELVEAESRTRPLLLVIDDFHWADERSVSLVEAALQTCENHAIALLAFGRPEAEERFQDFIHERRLQVLKLDRLSDEGSQSIVRAVCGPDVDADEMRAMVERSQGNAFFIEELLRARWRREARVPDTLLAAVDARIDALSPLSRLLIRAASVFGQRFWEPAIQVMTGAVASATASAVAELVSEELVVRDVQSDFPDAAQLTFRHALIREAAYARLTDEDRARGHRTAGAWLEQHGAREAAVVARHLDLGGEHADAAVWHVRAAEQALEHGDGRAAITHAECARKAGVPHDLVGRVRAAEGIALHDLGETDRSLEHLCAALERLPAGSSDWCGACALALPLLLGFGRLEEATALCETLLAPGGAGASPWIRAAAARAVLAVRTQRGSSELTERLVALAEGKTTALGTDRALDALRRGYLALARGVTASRQGALEDSIAASELAVASFEDAGNPRRQANALNRLGDALKNVGAYPRALAVLDEALVLVRRLGIVPTESTILSNRGYVLAMLGRVDESIVEAAKALELASRVRLAYAVVYSRAYLARSLLASGAVADALRHARLASDDAAKTPVARPFAETALAEALLRAGSAADALSRIVPIVAEAESPTGIDEGDALAHLVHAEALAAVGRREDATKAVRAARSRIEERALRISDPALRAAFLAIQEHSRTIDLAAAWSSPRA